MEAGNVKHVNEENQLNQVKQAEPWHTRGTSHIQGRHIYQPWTVPRYDNREFTANLLNKV